MFDDGTGQQIRGSGPAAEEKARQIDATRGAPPMQPSPELAALATPGPDMRTASAEDVIRGALAPKTRSDAGDRGITLPDQRITAAGPKKPAHSLTLPEQEITASGRRTEAEIRQADEDAKRNTERLSLLGTSGGNVVAGALGVERLPTGGKAPEKGGAAAGGDVDPSKVHFAERQQPLLPPMTGGGKVTTKEMSAGRTTQQNVIPDEDKQAIYGANDARYSAGQALIDAQSQRAERVAQTWREENTNLMREQEASQQRMAEARAQYSQMVGDVRRMNEEVQGQGIHDYWADKSTGTKFITALSVGLGVVGAGLQKKQTNAPMQMLTKAMDDDLDRQKSNLQNKRAGVAEANSLLGRYHELLGDMTAAEAAARSTMLDAAGRRVDQVMKETESPLVQANGKAMLAGIMQEGAEERAKLDAYLEHKSYKNVQLGGAPSRPFAKNDGSFLDLGGGVSIKASSPEMAMQWRQQLDNIPEIKDSVGELRAELAKGPSVTNTAKVKLLVNNVATSLGAAKIGTPRMTGQGELENVSHILDTGDKITSDVLGRVSAALDVAEHTADSAHRRIMNAAPRYTRGVDTPTGETIRYRLPEGAPQREMQLRPVE